MPEHRLARTRATLPADYQYGDAQADSPDDPCTREGHDWRHAPTFIGDRLIDDRFNSWCERCGFRVLNHPRPVDLDMFLGINR